MKTEVFSGTMAAVFGLNPWENLLILAVVLALGGAKVLPPMLKRLRDGNHDREETVKNRVAPLILFIAQGFGVGRVPVAPGTIGSLVGLLWFLLLLLTGNFWMYLGGTLIGLALSVPICGAAENILGQKDPGSVVLDEIAAMPVCFIPWIISHSLAHGRMPAPGNFFTGRALLMTVIIFALFRLFDILKPWPVRQSQQLPGGWGVTVDDVLAAVYVALITVPFVR